MGIRSPVSCASNAASSNCASLKVEKVAVRPCMVAMNRCWLTIMSATSRNLAFRTKSRPPLRLAPYRVERIVPQEKVRDGLVHAVASEVHIPCLDRAAKGRPHEIDRGRDRLRPEGNHSHRVVDLRPVGDEAVLLDEVACELGETIALAVTVKHRAEHNPRTSRKRARTRRSSRAAMLTFTMRHTSRQNKWKSVK